MGRSLRLCGIVVIALTCVRPARASVVHAQLPQSITAMGTILIQDGRQLPFSLTFRPRGGPVTGKVEYHGAGSYGDLDCDGTVEADLEGAFSGGDQGAFAGTGSGTAWFNCSDGTAVRIHYSGTWTGTLDANGHAKGMWHWIADFPDGAPPSVPGNATWAVAFSPDVFHAGMAAAITPADIFAAYGIRVKDGPGDYRSAPAHWSDAELALLNDLLKELPPSVIQEVRAARLLRGKADRSDHGRPETNEFGLYLACDLSISPTCTGSSATIRIFDRAHLPFDFANDPRGDTQFKATILHEMTHALENYRQPAAVFPRSSKAESSYPSSSLLEDWIAATRSAPSPKDEISWSDEAGWVLLRGKWLLADAPGNSAPTEYAEAGPSEDLAESVMLYVFDPGRLKGCSPGRYQFIHDHVFDGVEYQNGLRVEP